MATPPVTQTFNPAIGEYGQDYAVPVGTPIFSPIAGIVATEDMGKQDWGKRLFVHAQSGLSFAVGHLTAFVAQAGQSVQAGQLIGYSGGATSDPSSGVSTGPHVEVQFLNQAGHYLDPRSLGAQLSSFVSTVFRSGHSAAASVVQTPGQAAQAAVSAAESPIAGAIGSAASLATRAFWLVLAVVLAVIGTFLIISGELGKGLNDALDKADQAAAAIAPAAEKVAPEAAEVAA